MKLILTLILAFTGFTANAFEMSDSPLCDVFDLDGNKLVTIYTKHMQEDTKYNDWEKSQIMVYVTYNDGFWHDLPNPTFEQVREYFLTGDGKWDELHFTLFQDDTTGKKYSYVNSYPGDNEYGVFLDYNGNVIAEISDSDLIIDGAYCPWEE